MLHHVLDNQHTQNIQMNKVIGENEKCVLYFMEKLNRLFGQPNTLQFSFSFGWCVGGKKSRTNSK